MHLSAPMLQTFNALFAEAQAAGEPEPSAMTLATVSEDGRVSARTVLLKHVDERGFVFYTNVGSVKGRQLAARPAAALLFHWKHLRQGVQVRIEGAVEPVTDAEADAYFASRPRESQIGAWASRQSAPLADRAVLEERLAQVTERFGDGAVPRPPFWGGYYVWADSVELWVEGASRIHERARWTRSLTTAGAGFRAGPWAATRLQP